MIKPDLAIALFILFIFISVALSRRKKQQPTPPKYRLVFKIQGEEYMGTVVNKPVDQPITIQVMGEADKFGNAEPSLVPLDASPAPVWSIDQAALGALAPSDDGMSCVMTPSGTLGVATISLAASVGGQALQGSVQVQLVAGAVASITLGVQ